MVLLGEAGVEVASENPVPDTEKMPVEEGPSKTQDFNFKGYLKKNKDFVFSLALFWGGIGFLLEHFWTLYSGMEISINDFEFTIIGTVMLICGWLLIARNVKDE